MGKNVGLIGSVRGKVGNVVYAVQNGIQTVRAYQPTVANPRTQKQVSQRSKMSLAGKVSAVVPSTAIYGMGDNARTRRGAFIRNLIANTTTTSGILGGIPSSVADVDIVFSMGSAMRPVSFSSAVAGSNTLSVSLTGDSSISATDYAAYAVRIVVLQFDSSNNLASCQTVLATMPPQGQEVSTNLAMAAIGDYTAKIYLVPMRTSDGSALRVSTDAANLSDDDIVSTLTLTGSDAALEYGSSWLAGTVNFQSA